MTEVVRYIDGSIVGYCTDCEVRVEVTHVKGGVDSQILKQIAVSVLGNELPGDDRFLDMLKAAEENYEELGEVLKIARWVRDERS